MITVQQEIEMFMRSLIHGWQKEVCNLRTEVNSLEKLLVEKHTSLANAEDTLNSGLKTLEILTLKGKTK